jgi:SAM-dependent methyltransferase
LELVSRIGEIERLERFVRDLTAWSPVPSGSVLRVPAYSYPSWGILPTLRNADWLYAKSCNAWMSEWQETGPALNMLVNEASKDAGISELNTLMNEKIGELALPEIRKLIDWQGGFDAVDLGAGTGATTIAVLSAMLRHGVVPKRESMFLLVEPSASRLAEAIVSTGKLLAGSALEAPITIMTDTKTDVRAFAGLPNGMFDIALANAALHHHSFNNHLSALHRVLTPSGALFAGDWHNSMWERPSRVYWLLILLANPDDRQLKNDVLRFMGSGKNPPHTDWIERPEVMEFRRRFLRDGAEGAFAGLSEEERKANVGMAKFWLAVGRRSRQLGVRSPIYFLESHERLSMRVANLTNAGFTFATEERSKYHKLVASKGLGELSVVMRARNH